MYELKKKIGKVFMSKFVGTGPLSYEKRIYRAAVPRRLINTDLESCQIYITLYDNTHFPCNIAAY